MKNNKSTIDNRKSEMENNKSSIVSRQSSIKNNPIGVFDSGMGGLTVLRAIMDKLPGEDMLYFGDTAHLPYGNKSPEAITRYSLEVAEFFMERNVKLMVVACNTASVYALDTLKEKLSIPVIGVVESGVNAALNRAKKSIGIIGTYGTIKSRTYENKIRSRNPDIKIYSRHCPLFVPLVEEGWIDHPVTREVAGIYLSDLREKIDLIILACTHYPLIKGVISETLGPDVNVIDSAMEVAKAVENKIMQMNILNHSSEKQRSEFYVTDAPDNFIKMGEIFLGSKIRRVVSVNI